METSATSQLFLYSQKFDFDLYVSEPQKTAEFFFVPRSGSTLLACLLAQTKAFGFPLEYFSPVNVPYLEMRLSKLGGTFIDNLFKIRTTKNGVFSYKLDASMIGFSIEQHRSPDLFFIVDRLDRAAQAKSFARARLTKEWVLAPGEKSKHSSHQVTKEQIDDAMRILQEKREKIKKYIHQLGVRSLEINFEQIIEKPQGAVDEIFRYANIENNIKVDLNKVPIEKQS